jgi:hypothetical protein
MAQSATLTKHPVDMTLIKLTIPMIGGMIVMVIFNLIDTYFVGKLGTAQLAAMGFTFPIIMLQGSIAMGLGVVLLVIFIFGGRLIGTLFCRDSRVREVGYGFQHRQTILGETYELQNNILRRKVRMLN